MLKDAELDIIYRVRGEIFPYLLVENDGDDIPAISAIFWGEEEKNMFRHERKGVYA